MENQQFLGIVNQSYEKLTEQELINLGIVLGAYRSFRGDRRSHIAYVGMPITTGKRYFDVLKQEGVKTRQELTEKCGEKALWEMIMKPNIDAGITFADRLGRRENLLFIAPSVLEAKKWRWSDDAYMSLWYRVLGEMAGTHIVMDGWEYSYGGLREVLFSMFMQWRVIRPTTRDVAVKEFGLQNLSPLQNFMPPNGFYADMYKDYEAMWNIRILDSELKELHLDEALAKSVAAITELKERGLPCDDLFNASWKLMLILIPFFSPFMMSDQKPYECWTPLYWEARERLHKMMN